MTSPVDSQPKLTLAEKVWRDHVVTHGTGDTRPYLHRPPITPMK